MAVYLPNGSTLQIATGFAGVKTMSAVSNANPAVATLAASHGVVDNDILLVTSGWSRLNNRVVRAGTVSTNDVPLLGIDSSDTSVYPASGGVGTVNEISGWQQIQQVLGFEPSGGDQQHHNYQFLEDDDERQLPTVRSPTSISIKVADDISLPWYAYADTADQARTITVLRVLLKNGGVIYYTGILSLNRTPNLTVNQVAALDMTFSLQAAVTRYAA